jgi:hypothetical protein
MDLAGRAVKRIDRERLLARIATFGMDEVREELVELSEDDTEWFRRESFARARYMREWYGAPHCGDVHAAPDIPVKDEYL